MEKLKSKKQSAFKIVDSGRGPAQKRAFPSVVEIQREGAFCPPFGVARLKNDFSLVRIDIGTKAKATEEA